MTEQYSLNPNATVDEGYTLDLQSKYNPELGYAFIQRPWYMSSPQGNSPLATCLLNRPGEKWAAIRSYVMARLSRCPENFSVPDFMREVIGEGQSIDAAERLAVIHNYGHASVCDAADICVILENIPIYLAFRIQNMTRIHACQERSTRYANFNNSNWAPMDITDAAAPLYNRAMQKAIENYHTIYEEAESALLNQFVPTTKEELKSLRCRAFDIARYCLPIGINTKVGFVMNARTWAQDVIAILTASPFEQERFWGWLIRDLLIGTDDLKHQGYVPEADLLIRHFEPNEIHYDYLKEMYDVAQGMSGHVGAMPGVNLFHFLNTEGFFWQLMAMGNPSLDLNNANFESVCSPTPEVKAKLGKILADFDNYFHLKEVGETGPFFWHNRLDLGALRDLNRHRALSMHIPLLNPVVPIEKEMNRPGASLYRTPPYLALEELSELQGQYINLMDQYYTEHLAFLLTSSKRGNEYTRMALPLAHETYYQMGGSLSKMLYTLSLRVRNGGHVAYRQHCHEMVRTLGQQFAMLEEWAAKHSYYDLESREQFFDRS